MQPSLSIPARRSYGFLAGLCVAHALALLLIWLGDSLSPRVWLFFSWLWLVWPPALALHPARSARRVMIPVLCGAALLAPCVPTIATFTAWSIGGFAP